MITDLLRLYSFAAAIGFVHFAASEATSVTDYSEGQNLMFSMDQWKLTGTCLILILAGYHAKVRTRG